MRAISAASTAISLPKLPIATPTLAVFRAGASFTPSPIIQTVLCCCSSLLICMTFSSGSSSA